MNHSDSHYLSKYFILIIIVVMLFPFSLHSKKPSSTEIKNFADHLFKEGDYIRAAMEYEKFRYHSNTISDSILFKIGLCHQMRNNYKFASRNFNEILKTKPGQLTSTARIAYLYNLSKAQEWKQIRKFGFTNSHEFYFYYQASLNSDQNYNIEKDMNNLENDSLKHIYQTLHQHKDQLNNKSPVLAGILSFIFPGLGKAYINRKGDGFFSFIMTGLASFTSYRAFEAELIITGVVTSGIALSFYLGTIYGSYIGAKIHNQNMIKKWQNKLAQLNPVKQKPYWKEWLKN